MPEPESEPEPEVNADQVLSSILATKGTAAPGMSVDELMAEDGPLAIHVAQSVGADLADRAAEAIQIAKDVDAEDEQSGDDVTVVEALNGALEAVFGEELNDALAGLDADANADTIDDDVDASLDDEKDKQKL